MLKKHSFHLTSAFAFAALAAAAAPLSGSDAHARATRSNQTPLPQSLQTAEADLPLTIVVSLKKQRLAAYRGTRQIASSRISSGKRGHRTPKGVFTILQKRRRHYSNLYAGAPMPYMQRVTWSGIALHAGRLPGYPASHGCIRLPYSFARKFFSMTSMADRVIVTDDLPKPRIFADDNLIKPLPPGNPTAHNGRRTGKAGSEPRTDASGHWFPGISSAKAAQVHEELTFKHTGPLTRAAVAASRARHLDKLAKLAEESKAWTTTASDKLRQANIDLRALLQEPRRLKAQISDLKVQILRVTRAEQSIERQMRDLFLAAAYPDALNKTTDTVLIAPPPARRSAALDARRNASGVPKPTLIRETGSLQKSALTWRQRAELKARERARQQLEKREEVLEEQLLQRITERDRLQRELAKTETALAAHDDVVSAAMTKRDILKERYTAAYNHHQRILAGLKKAKRLQKRYEKPITVLISRKKQKLWVRQARDEILATDITIEKPDAPIGTHVFTAMSYTGDGRDMRWKAITAAQSTARIRRTRGMSRSEHRRLIREANRAAGRQTPRNALARINIPEPVKMQLAELIKPGSTIIVTDSGKGNETGKHTDLIAQF